MRFDILAPVNIGVIMRLGCVNPILIRRARGGTGTARRLSVSTSVDTESMGAGRRAARSGRRSDGPRATTRATRGSHGASWWTRRGTWQGTPRVPSGSRSRGRAAPSVPRTRTSGAPPRPSPRARGRKPLCLSVDTTAPASAHPASASLALPTPSFPPRASLRNTPPRTLAHTSTLTLSPLTPLIAPSPPRRRAGRGIEKPEAAKVWLPESESGTSVSSARAAHPGPASRAGSDDPTASRRRWRIEKLVRSETPQAAAQLPGVAPPAISRA